MYNKQIKGEEMRTISKKLLLGDSFWPVEKNIMRILGADACVLLSVIADAEKIFKEGGEENKWVFQTIEQIEELTGMKKKKQATAIRILLVAGVIEQQNKGNPCRRYFRIDYTRLEKLMGIKDWKNTRIKLEKDLKDLRGESSLPQRGKVEIPNRENIYKEDINKEHNINDLSKDKLEETSSSMELDVKPVEKYILPNDNNLYSLFKSYLEKWNSYPGTTSHSLKPIESNQTQIVYNSFSYLLSAINGPVEFLQKYKSELDEKWLEKYNINEESLTSIPKDVLKKVLNNYASGLVKGQKIKEENYILSSRLSEFFMYKTHIRSGQADKAKTISWYLYSCIKLAGKAEKPLERKYPDSYTSIYNKIDKLFGVNRKQLDKTSTALQNDCYRLAEDLIDNITLKKKKLKEEGIRVCRYQTSNLYQDFEDFYKTTSFMTDNVRTNPTTFMSNRNSWNNFIDFLRDKYGEPGKDKERYDLFKNNKEQQ